MSVSSVIFGGGCFWCTEALIQRLNGVTSVISGYSGGDTDNPTYKDICTGQTNHAEVIKVEFDSSIISFAELIDIFLEIHDPTTLNQQGADKGTQYRSVIFYKNDNEKSIIENSIKKAQKLYHQSIVTEVKEEVTFYAAEDYHQNYYNDNPQQGFCHVVIGPKVEKFLKNYQDKIKS